MLFRRSGSELFDAFTNIILLRIFPLWNTYSWKMLRKLKWQIPGETLAARYNWCQGPVPGRGPVVEKHWLKPFGVIENWFHFWTGAVALLHSSRIHRATYPVITKCTFLRIEAAGAWSWLIAFIWFRGEECLELCLHSPYILMSCILNKHRNNATFSFWMTGSSELSHRQYVISAHE